MARLCYFCQSKIAAAAARDVVKNIGDLVFILTTGNTRETIRFTQIIEDLFDSNDFEDDDQFVCKECFSSFTTVYKFKKQFQASVEPTSLKREVNEFLDEAQEPIAIVNHHSCLSLVPESKVEFVNNFVKLIDSLHESSTETPKSQVPTPSIDNPTRRTVTAPVETATSFQRASIHSPSYNRVSSFRASNVTTETLMQATMSGARKRKSSPQTPERVAPAKTPKLNNLSVTPTLTRSPRQSTARGRPPISSADDHEPERQLTPKAQKQLLKQIQSSKVGVRTYKCSDCGEQCANYKEIRSHILENHFD